MKSLRLDETGDLVVNGRKNLDMIEGADEVRQRNEITLAINEGEWFLNKSLGLPWTEKILRKGTTKEETEREIVQTLLEDYSIESIDNLEFDINREKRSGKIYFEGTLINGEDFRMEAEV